MGNASKRCDATLQCSEALPTKSLTLVIEGNPLKRKEQYASDVRYKIVSYNCMSNDVKMWGSLQSNVVIMDEVQRPKNWKTQISLAARKVHSDEHEPLKDTPTYTEPAAAPAPSSSSTTVPRHPQELVTQGISFLSGLAQTLQSPEATQQLVDTNTETGESHLRIPVPDKQTVQALLNFVGKLFAK